MSWSSAAKVGPRFFMFHRFYLGQTTIFRGIILHNIERYAKGVLANGQVGWNLISRIPTHFASPKYRQTGA